MPPTHYTPLEPPLGPIQRPTISWNLLKHWKRDNPNTQTYVMQKKAYFSFNFSAFGLLYLPISWNGHMSTALLNSGASYNFIVLPQLKKFAPNSKDLQWAKPLQVKLSDKSSIISPKIATIFV